jgi:hypothetical protein
VILMMKIKKFASVADEIIDIFIGLLWSLRGTTHVTSHVSQVKPTWAMSS